MNDRSWHSVSVRLPGEGIGVRVQPLETPEPMGDQQILIQYHSVSSISIVLTADQADQLEHELERARWHRVFKQRERLTVVHEPEFAGDHEPVDPDEGPRLMQQEAMAQPELESFE